MIHDDLAIDDGSSSKNDHAGFLLLTESDELDKYQLSRNSTNSDHVSGQADVEVDVEVRLEAEVDSNKTDEPQSFLPSWVLDFRKKINASRAIHSDAESRLDSITRSVASLDINLLKLTSTGRGGEVNSGNESDADVLLLQKPTFPLHLIPSDVLTIVLDYLLVETIIGQLECTSALIQNCIAESPYWSNNLTKYCPHVRERGRVQAWTKGRERLIVSRHMKSGYDCLNFVRLMKEQRCVRRHDTIVPKRHTAKERSVTHPLPIFESIRNIPNLKDCRGSSNTTSFTSDYIMSRSNTLNSDFRVTAHRTLEAMYNITARSYSDSFSLRFVEEGAVTVLISLLSNEAGVVCHFSCSILANLLVWEARRKKLQRIQADRDSDASCTMEVGDDDDDEDGETPSKGNSVDSTFKPLREQLEACGGKNMLVLLLTSPSASINLAGNVARVSGGLREKRMQASVEGVSSREAARALVTLFNSRKPVPASMAFPADASSSNSSSNINNNSTCGNTCDSTCDRNSAFSTPSNSPTALASPLRSHSFSECAGSGGSGCKSPLTGGRLPPLLHSQSLHSPDDRRNHTFSCGDSPPPPTSGPVPVLAPAAHKDSMMSSLFLGEDYARPWRFSYYHKSGSLKDRFTTYLHFTPDGFIRGRGVDFVGVFTLFGQADADSSGGHTYFFHKVYVGEDVINRFEEESGGVHHVRDPDLDSMDIRLQMWLQRAHVEYVFEGRTRTHVSHTGYWSSGVDAAVEGGRVGGQMNQKDGNRSREAIIEGDTGKRRHRWSSEDVLGVWGMGLYGVWETSSIGSHFDLQKGGVFRAEPVIA